MLPSADPERRQTELLQSPDEIDYTPAPALADPRRLARTMLRDMAGARELAWRLFLRDFRTQYRHTYLGYGWVVIPPLVTTFIWVFLQKQEILHVGETGVPYSLYVVIGILLWDTFLAALSSPLTVISASSSMLAKINFPREALLLAGLGQVVFGALVRLALIVAVLLWYQVPWTPSMLFAPLGVGSLILLGYSAGLFLVPFGMLYHDIARSTGLLHVALFFLTPVIYPPPTEGPAALLMQLNPIAPLLVTTREMMTTGRLSCLPSFLAVSVAGCLIWTIGWLAYRLALPHIVSRLNA